MNTSNEVWKRVTQWWIRQGEIQGRQKMWVVLGCVVATLLFSPILPMWITNLLICAAVVVGSFAVYRFVMRRRAAKGNDKPLGEWAKLALVLGGGGVAILVVIPFAFAGFMRAGDTGQTLLVAFLLIIVELLAVATVLALAGFQFHRARGGSGTLPTEQVASEWAGADAKSLEIVEVLRTPRLINPKLYDAGLAIKEKPLGVARPRSAPETGFGQIAARVMARPRSGVLTVNGEKLTVPRLVSISRTSVGPVAFFSAIPGTTENAYDYAADKLEVSLRVGEIRVAQLPEDRARGVMRMTFVTNDPLRQGTVSTFFEDHPATTPLLLPLATTEDGGTYSLPMHHTLIVGATGSGKGGVIQGAIRQLAPWQSAGLVRLYGADPKRAELKGYERTSLFEEVEFDTEGIADMARSLVCNVLRPRQEASGRSFVLSDENPLVLFVIDEFSSLTQDKNYTKSGLYENLNVLLSQGRSDGVYVLAASQVGHKEVLGGLRQHFANRIALRVDTAIEVDMVLGAGSQELGARPHLIPKANESNRYATAGVGYVNSDDSPRPLRIRFPFTSDGDIQNLIDRYPAPPPKSVTEPEGLVS